MQAMSPAELSITRQPNEKDGELNGIEFIPSNKKSLNDVISSDISKKSSEVPAPEAKNES